jgi:S1-C subfamily serine protease
MLRALTVFTVAVLCCASLAGAAETAQLRGGTRCPEGHPETGDIGIEYLLCVGGSCAVNLRSERGYAHDFSTEPLIRGIRPGSPSAGKLHTGDILIAIDGVLITTRDGGRRLANLRPGVPVTLRVRRNGKEMDVTVVPETGCNMPRLAVLARPATGASSDAAAAVFADPVRPSMPRPRLSMNVLPAVDFGMELECDSCGWYGSPRGPAWFSNTAPVVHAVEPGGPAAKAGFRPGDVLLKVDGQMITGAGGRHLGELAPGKPATFQVRRGKQFLDLQITPRAPQRQRQKF